MLWDAVSTIKSTFQGFSNETKLTTNALAIGLVVCIVVHWWMTRRKYNLPPGPIGLPILGYLPFLGKEIYKDFERLSKHYGNVMGLYLGRTYTVVLGDYEAVKEGLGQTATLARPLSNLDFAADGGGFSTVNSTEWVEQRRFAVRAMRDIGLGGSKWENIIQEQVDEIIQAIEKRNGAAADYSKLFSENISNSVATLVFGHGFPVGDPARQLIDRTIDLDIETSAVGSLRNFFPAAADLLAKFDLGGQAQELHSTFAKFTDLLNKGIQERRTVYKIEDSDIFIDGYLKEIDANLRENLNNTFNERNLRGTILTLLVAGSDTTNASLLWLFLAMAKYPDIQEKVHRELDAVLGKEGRPKYTERSKLPYTYAVLQEGSRWMTIVPLSVPREATEDTKINGYDIPKGTLILPNLYAVHKNQKYWKEPEKFIPERYLTHDGLPIVSKSDGYIAFSYGKRNCPGETVAKITILQYFVGVMQRFKVLPPVGKVPMLEGRTGITYRPVYQELRFIPKE